MNVDYTARKYLMYNSHYDYPPVYLHSIFEISSVTRIFYNFKISSLKNWKINLISKLIFAGYTGSRNQVQTRKKIKLVLNSIFFQVWNKLRNPKFENRVQRDRAFAPQVTFALCNFRNTLLHGTLSSLAFFALWNSLLLTTFAPWNTLLPGTFWSFAYRLYPSLKMKTEKA